MRSLKCSGGAIVSESGVLHLVVLSGDPMPDWGGQIVIDLATLQLSKETLTVDYNHNESEIVGKAYNIQIDNDKLIADAELVSYKADDRAGELAFKIAAGVPYEVSSLIETYPEKSKQIAPGATEIVNNRPVVGPATVYYNAVLRGVTICPYARDSETAVELLNKTEEKTMAAEDKTVVEEKIVEKIDEKTVEPARPDLEQFIDEFGIDRGVEYYRRGITIEDARAEDYAELKEWRRRSEVEKKIDDTVVEKVDKTEDRRVEEEFKASLDEIGQRLGKLELLNRRGEPEPVENTPTAAKKEHKLGAKGVYMERLTEIYGKDLRRLNESKIRRSELLDRIAAGKGLPPLNE